jgi:hypothetical protein
LVCDGVDASDHSVERRARLGEFTASGFLDRVPEEASAFS